MRNNRKLKLKICSSNVKNFPKDFFADLHEKEGVMTPKKNDAGYRVDFNDSLIKLRPCTLNIIKHVLNSIYCLFALIFRSINNWINRVIFQNSLNKNNNLFISC